MFSFKDRLDTYPSRVWINQPSNLQPFHALHGKVGISIPPVIKTLGAKNDYIKVMFVEGDTISQFISISALSWKS